MIKPLSVLMLGYPGSGKSTVARTVARSGDFVVLQADVIRINIFQDPTWTPAEHRIVFSLLSLLTRQLLVAGHSVITDANHNQIAVRLEKYAEAVQCNATPLTIHVTVPEHIQAARTASREAQNATEAIPSEKLKLRPSEIFTKVSAGFEPPHNSEPVIQIDGSLDPSLQLQAFTQALEKKGILVPKRAQHQPRLYLMLGLPGSGKTTAATELAKQTGAIHVSSDAYRLALFPKPSFSEHEHQVLYAALDYLTELLLVQGISVIYDANLNRLSHRQDKYDICKKTNTKSALLWVQTSHAVAKDRRVNDSHLLLRPPYESPEAMFNRIAAIFEAPDPINEPYTILDGTSITADYIRSKLPSQ